MRHFIQDFFRNYEAEVAEADGGLKIKLTEELAQVFGQPEFKLVFSTRELDEESDLVTPGSPVMDRIHDFLQERGQKLFAELTPRREADQTLGALRFGNCAASMKKGPRRKVADTYFTIKVIFLSDEKSEEIHTVLVDRDGKTQIVAMLPWDDDAPPEQVAAPPRTAEEMKEDFAAARRALADFLRPRTTQIREELVARAHAAVTRLRSYYAQQLAELNAEFDAGDRNLAQEVTDERQDKIAAEIERHRLLVTFHLVNVMVLRRTVQTVEVGLRSSRATADLSLEFDLYSGKLTGLKCGHCGAEKPETVLGDCGHTVCSDCVGLCEKCGKTMCRSCLAGKCHICVREVCRECMKRCAACNEIACADHLKTCQICGGQVCDRCAAPCSDCGKTICASHMVACARCGGRVCPDCSAKCPRCGGTVCRRHRISCELCGQEVCDKCASSCASCGKRVCDAHLVSCKECGRRGCESHFIRCGVSEEFVCAAHASECPRCGRLALNSLMTTCPLCQETVCPFCATEKGLCVPCREIAGGRAPFAEQELLDTINTEGRMPEFLLRLQGWRCARTRDRLFLSAATSYTRVLAICDCNGKLLKWRRFSRFYEDENGKG
ncbi:MAG TPA: hypothetical protein PL033_11035 [Candidatus Brocadiia bacterium]|nr:hypothetical protein [Candidatus Brocadiia bacterium]